MPVGMKRRKVAFIDRPVLWEANFSVLPLSTGANSAQLKTALQTMGLTFTRASVATVQTAANTVVVSGIAADDPRVGDAGFGRGLVLEETRTNQITNSNPGGYSPTNVTISATTGPAGESAGEIADASAAAAGFGLHSYTQTVSVPYACSVWLQDVSGNAGTKFGANWNGLVLNFRVTRPASTSNWFRQTTTGTSSATASTNVVLLPAADTAADLGTTRYALVQAEAGRFPTESIVTSGGTATRATERLRHSTFGAQFVQAGGYSVETVFIPKFASGEVSASSFIYRHDTAVHATHYLFVSTGNQIGFVGPGGAFSSAALTWSRGSVIRTFTEIIPGGTSRLFVKVDNGAVVTASSTAITAITGSSYFDFFSVNGASNVSCWAQSICAYRSGRRPVWVG